MSRSDPEIHWHDAGTLSRRHTTTCHEGTENVQCKMNHGTFTKEDLDRKEERKKEKKRTKKEQKGEQGTDKQTNQ